MSDKFISDDSIECGFLKILGADVTPFADPQSGKILFKAENSGEALEKLYSNAKVASLDAMAAIKSLRQAIYAMRQRNGRTNNGRSGY